MHHAPHRGTPRTARRPARRPNPSTPSSFSLWAGTLTVAAALSTLLLPGVGFTQPSGGADPGLSGARLLVANPGDDENGRIDIFDALGVLAPGSGFNSNFDEGDAVTIGNVIGDSALEIVVAEGGANDMDGGLSVYDASGRRLTDVGFDTAYDNGDDELALGDINNDGYAEVIVANSEGGRIDVHDVATKSTIGASGFDTTFNDDSHNQLAVGDANGDGRVEVFIANDSGGRIDVLDPRTGQPVPGLGVPDTTFNNDDGNEFAVGDLDGDGQVEVFIANADEGGRIDVLDPRTGQPLPGRGAPDTTFDNTDENQFKVADVNGDGLVEILIANADEGGRIDVIDPHTGLPMPGFGVATSGFDSKDVFAVSDFGDFDFDGDGIPNRVELRGIFGPDGALVLDLKELGAHPCRKDIIVEIDYMLDDSTVLPGHDHQPSTEALKRVRNIFLAAPVARISDCPFPNPPRVGGINLLYAPMEAVPRQRLLRIPEGFDAIKERHFNQALDPYVHYSLFINLARVVEEDGTVNTDLAGQASPSRDAQDFFVTSLGGAVAPSPNESHQARIFMHELGHAIGLGHGGDVGVNCKPNYLSIMNYLYVGSLINDQKKSLIDFSGGKLRDLDENSLDEPAGLSPLEDGDEPPPALHILWGDASGVLHAELANQPRLDWSGDNSDGEGGDDDDRGVRLNLNDNFRGTNAGGNFINLTDCMEEGEKPLIELTGFNDWAKLANSVQPISNPDVANAVVEPTAKQIAEVQALWDQALFPDQVMRLDAPRAGFFGSTESMALDEQHVYALHYYRPRTPSATGGPPGTLVMYDRATLQVVARIPVGLAPRSVAVNPLTQRAYVINRQNDATVSVIDTAARKVVGTIPLGQGAADVAVNTRLNRVYISNPFQQVIHVIDGATGTVLPPIGIGPGAVGLTVDETHNLLHVALLNRSFEPRLAALGTVQDDGTAPPLILPRVDLGDPLIQPVDVAVDPQANRVYVAGLGGGGVAPSVTVIDQSTRQVLTRIPMPGPVRAISFNPLEGTLIAIGDRGVEVIDASMLRVSRHIDAGVPFAGVTGKGADRQIFVGDFLSGELRRFSYSSGVPRP